MSSISLIAAFVAATTAIFAAIVAFSGFVIAKDLKTTEFRQAWIDAQRADLATIVAFAYKASHLPPRKQRKLDLTRFGIAAARVEMREHAGANAQSAPIDPEWPQTRAAIARMREYIRSGSATPMVMEVPINTTIGETRVRLSIEWRLVKAGEQGYRNAKRWLLGVGVIALALTGFAATYLTLNRAGTSASSVQLTITPP